MMAGQTSDLSSVTPSQVDWPQFGLTRVDIYHRLSIHPISVFTLPHFHNSFGVRSSGH